MRPVRRPQRQGHDLEACCQHLPADLRSDAGRAPGDDSDFAPAHARPLETSASTRNGLPLPCLIFSGAAIITAPFGGS
jgi:hypothetical protein